MLPRARDAIAAEIDAAVDDLFDLSDIDASRVELNLHDGDKGDLATAVPLEVAHRVGADPRQVAGDIADATEVPDEIAEVSVDGPGYVNFSFDRDTFMTGTVDQILSEGAEYGHLPGDDLVMMDVSSPNVAKPLHIGHLRNTVMGLALANVLEARGNEVIRDNHIGDWGTQFGNLMFAYDQHQRGEDAYGIFDEAQVEHDFGEEPVDHLLDLYQAFGRREKALDEAGRQDELEMLRDEGRDWFRRLREGDADAQELWEEFKDVSIDRFKTTYDMLDAEFDEWIGEGFYVLNGYTDDIVDQALDSGVAVEKPDGSVVIPLGADVPHADDFPLVDDEDADITEFMIRKSDGTTLYGTRDLATIAYREEEWGPDEILYVVASEQDEYFQDLFDAADRMGFDSDDLFHVSYGMLSLPEGSMSTRQGTVIRARDLLQEARDEAYDIVTANNPDLAEDEAREIAEQIGLAATKFENLKVGRTKDVTFDMDRALDFQGGDTGPYIQYAATRAGSILDEGGVPDAMPDAPSYNETDESLVRTLAMYPLALESATDQYDPAPVAQYMLDVAQEFNSFYHSNRVLDADEREERLAITGATRQVLDNGTDLLGFDTPAQM